MINSNVDLAKKQDASPPVVLEVENIWKRFGSLQVLKGTTLSVRAGERVAVVGENGSGKSVLLKILMGLEQADQGQVRVHGRVGYCPQDLGIFEGLTISENLVLFGAGYGMNTDELRSQGRYYLDRFRYGQFVDRIVGKLSGGTKQKLNLTLSLLHSPDLLLLDEPYQGFDYETFINFANILQEWSMSGKAVLTISHLVTSDLGFDRILELRDGVISELSTSSYRV